MADIRVLIVDDSAVVRRLLGRIIEEAPGLAVAGQAGNGRRALEILETADPDLVTLDVEMPEMDGLATLRELRRLRPRLPVIMFSTLTSRGASTTLEALALGAADYLTKPEGAANLQEALESLRRELVPRVRALARRRERSMSTPVTGEALDPRRRPVSPPPPPRPGATARPARDLPLSPATAPPLSAAVARSLARPAELLVIGVSTGGPNALASLVPALPATLPVPVLIVQHMPPLFTKMLADRLNQLSPLTVREAEAGAALVPGEAWVARGDWHMEVVRDGRRLVLAENQRPQVNSCRPAVDPLFSSAVRACGGAILAVVLTGMGHDGLAGAREIRDAGGLVLAQDEDSSVVWGMPGAVATAGVADAVLPLEGIAPQVVQLLRPPLSHAGRTSAWR